MTKKQKVWLWIFLGMFLVPEVSWSSVFNVIYSFFMPLENGSIQVFRQNFLQNRDNINIYSSILFIQFLGLLLLSVYLAKLNLEIKKWYLWVLVAVLLILTIITFFIFGLSVQLRSIGF